MAKNRLDRSNNPLHKPNTDRAGKVGEQKSPRRAIHLLQPDGKEKLVVRSDVRTMLGVSPAEEAILKGLAAKADAARNEGTNNSNSTMPTIGGIRSVKVTEMGVGITLEDQALLAEQFGKMVAAGVQPGGQSDVLDAYATADQLGNDGASASEDYASLPSVDPSEYGWADDQSRGNDTVIARQRAETREVSQAVVRRNADSSTTSNAGRDTQKVPAMPAEVAELEDTQVTALQEQMKRERDRARLTIAGIALLGVAFAVWLAAERISQRSTLHTITHTLTSDAGNNTDVPVTPITVIR